MTGWDRVVDAVIDRRAELGWTQERLAAEADVAVRTIRSLERGEARPQPTTRGKIERALGWRPGEFRRIEREEPPQVPPRLRQDIIDFLGERRAAAVLANMDREMRGEPPPGTSGPGGGRREERAAAS